MSKPFQTTGAVWLEWHSDVDGLDNWHTFPFGQTRVAAVLFKKDVALGGGRYALEWHVKLVDTRRGVRDLVKPAAVADGADSAKVAADAATETICAWLADMAVRSL